MELNVHDNTKIVEVWLTNAEKNDPAVQTRLNDLYAKYKEKKYTVAVFHSGGGDLYQSTRELLAYNKRRCAELAAQRTSKLNPSRRAAGMER